MLPLYRRDPNIAYGDVGVFNHRFLPASAQLNIISALPDAPSGSVLSY
jgi:hypothetical protein